ncbi:hypothetical protein [Arthrobacter sp. BPSS-3]|uniref:DUF7793 family protein n=1 Tax=Arthrobacter sp. BPSS-3 TaxID=3366580 RepID=UPI0037DDA3AD
MTTLTCTDNNQYPLAEESQGQQTLDAGPANVSLEVEGEAFLRITFRPGSRITGADGIRVREQLLALTGGTGCVVLLQVTGVDYVSREAVRVFSEAVTVKAFAFLGRTPMDRVIAHGRRGLPLPLCPSRYFTDESEALAWLNTISSVGND